MGIVALTWGCQDQGTDTVKEYTGTQTVYPLQAGSEYEIDGTVTFRERTDGTADIDVALSGTEGNSLFPVHLHLGDITTDGASVAALLNPVLGKTGKSDTHLKILSDESTITYKQLVALNACIKVHLSDSGPNQDVVLAGGNIGKAAADNLSSGRVGIAVCKSN